MKNKFEYLLLLLIILSALAVRLYKVDNPIADWHSWRQADTASTTSFFVKDGIDLFHPRYHDISSLQTGYENSQGYRFVEFPIFNAIHSAFYQTFGRFSLEVWGRLTSILASLISVIFIYFIGKKMLGGGGGLLASFFFAFLPFNIYFSRVILPEPLAVTLGLGAICFFIFWLEKQHFWQMILATLFFALGLLVKPFIIFYGVPLLYLAIVKFGWRGVFRQFWLWIFTTVSLIPFFAWRAWMGRIDLLVGIPFWSWAFNGDNIRFRPSFWYWLLGERVGNLILGGWAILPFSFGFIKKAKNLFPHFFALGSFAYLSVVATANVRHDYYQTLIVPSVAILLAWGTIMIWQIKGFLVKGVLVSSILLGFALSAYRVKEFYKINHPEIVIAGAAVDKLTPPDSKVIAPYFGDTAFLYQTGRIGWPHATLPIEEMINKLGAQYYVSVNFDQQTQEVIEQYVVIEKTPKYVIVDLTKKR